ncbi:MAG: hypothetical protein ACI4EO_02525 [Blautia sp.]
MHTSLNLTKDLQDFLLCDPLKVTWSWLFPRKLQNCLLKGFQSKDPDAYNQIFPEGTKIEFTKYIVRLLIPDDFRKMDGETDLAAPKDFTQDPELKKSDNIFSRYWTGNPSLYYRYDATIHRIREYASVGCYSFDTFKFHDNLKKNLKILLSWLSNQERMAYESYIHALIEQIDRIPSLKEINLLHLFENKEDYPDFCSKLSSLVSIAATLPVWDRPEINYKDLAVILLPYRPAVQSRNTNNEEWQETYVTQRKNSAAQKLTAALSDFEAGDYRSCGQKCSEIIDSFFVDDIIIGNAYYHLAICCLNHGYEYKGHTDIIPLLEKSLEYGYTDAAHLLKTYSESTSSFPELLSCKPIHAISENAYLVFNTSSENACVHTFIKTIPKSKEKEELRKEHMIFALSDPALKETVTPHKDLRYLLFHDDHKKNFQDFIHILDTIEYFGKSDSKKTAEMNWSNITIYLRICEDRYTSLLDTALKRIPDAHIHLYTIDDARWPVQQLLSYHPLFYSFSSFGKWDLHDSKAKSVTLNYTVISAKDDQLTNWLVREAFWLGCFFYKNICLNINVISPEAAKIDARLHFDCPNMYTELPDSQQISAVRVNPSTQVDFLSSANLISALNELNKVPNTFHYIIVNGEDEIESLNLGIRIREWSIQQIVQANRRPDKASLPVIAFHCKDTNIGHLSRQLVVQTIEHGDAWFNNYNLIPFGMLNDRYTWDEIDGGYLERMAQCTHLQYRGLEPSASKEEAEKYLMDYFRRSYNRDSSMSVALSMPYRLFQTAVDTEMDHLLPPDRWEISEKYPFTQGINVQETAKQFRDGLSNIYSNKENLTFYEHTRWLRWSISHGWITAKPEQVVNYIKAGNPGQQLFIARMHGCICSVDDLKLLSDTLCENATKNNWKPFAARMEPITIKQDNIDRRYTSGYKFIPKDFMQTNQSNIEMTPEILRTEWFTHENSK